MERKLWFEHYDEGIPHTLRPYPMQNQKEGEKWK
jgi:hypothetical protein